MSHWVRAQTMRKVTKNVGKSTQTMDMAFGHYVKVRRKIREVKEETADPRFIEACREAGVRPTVRQRNKFARKTGTAYAHRKPEVQPTPEVQSSGDAA